MTVPRVALICSEPIRRCMAGAGIRYAEMSRALCAAGLDVSLIAPLIEKDMLHLGPTGHEVAYSEKTLSHLDGNYDAVVVQGHLVDTLLPLLTSTPVVVDLYDPSMLENVSYVDALGKELYERDLRMLRRACLQGDFFLCASEEQRSYYLGCLTALDRLNPSRLVADPDGRGLIDVVPFGVPEPLPSYRPYLPPPEPRTRRLLFGGLYDWYDPWIVISALEREELQNCRLLFVRNPNPESTPQQLLKQIEAFSRANSDIGNRIDFLDWVPWERRFDLLRDVDLLVAPHRESLESRFSMRTRFLEAMAVGCLVAVTDGGAVSGLVREYTAGVIVPPGDSDALGEGISAILAADRTTPAAGNLKDHFARDFSWRRVVSPLVDFCRNPAIDPFKPKFGDKDKVVHVLGERRYKGHSFSVIVPTFNRLDSLPSVIEALGNQYNPPDFALIIIDDGSTDGTTDWLRKQTFRIPTTLIYKGVTSGPAMARNEASVNATGEYIAFLGDDIIPDRFWLATHAERHRRCLDDDEVVVVGHTDWHKDVPHTRFRDFLDTTGWQFGYDRIGDPENAAFNFLYASNMSITRKLFLANPFNTSFPYPAWEDTELGYRLQNMGVRLVYEPSARAEHLHRPGVRRMAERHRRTGYVAVELCRHHPELESLALPAEDRMHSASGAVVRNLRKWFAIALERLPINIPATWENVLRDHYVAGIKEYMREHKLAKLPEARAFPITFSASSPLLGHKTGSEKGLSWRCTPGKDEPGHGIYGPGLAIHDDDQLEADFFIGWASTELNTRPLAVLDVFDQSSDTIIATASVKSTAISSSDVRVRIPFSGRTGQRLEFRVFWHGTCPLEISRIEVHRASRSLHGGS